MNIGKAVRVFKNIESDEYTDEQKALAIYQVMNMPTHNSITKDQILNAMNWLWHQWYEITEEEQ